MKEKKFNKAEYDQQYLKKNHRRIAISFSEEYDADVLQKLDQQGNKTEYIRQLIRSDIKANK